MSAPFRFHWMMPKGGEVAMEIGLVLGWALLVHALALLMDAGHLRLDEFVLFGAAAIPLAAWMRVRHAPPRAPSGKRWAVAATVVLVLLSILFLGCYALYHAFTNTE